MSASGHPMEVTAEGEKLFGEYNIPISVVPSLDIQDNLDIHCRHKDDTRPTAIVPLSTD